MQNSTTMAAVPDAFQRLWTPHRMVYIQNGQDSGTDACPFCVAPSLSDEEALIVARGTHVFVLLNLFPYNSGHLLVCPYRHVAMYDEATAEESQEIATLTQTAMRVIRSVSHNDGFNIGMNQGRVAGAGIAEHLHQHIVPRWAQDANFFPIIAKTKALPQLLGDVRANLAAAWPTSDHE
ncbi:MAG: HIT domain-containing protein [Microbacteriaceae bacterium]